MNDRELGAIGHFGIVTVILAFLFVLVLGGCAAIPAVAHEAGEEDDGDVVNVKDFGAELVPPPTYWDCMRKCLRDCNGAQCSKTGRRPVGVRDGQCTCAPFDA